MSSENNGADQLRGYREADLRLCFRLCRLLVFPWGGSDADISVKTSKHQPTNCSSIWVAEFQKFSSRLLTVLSLNIQLCER